MTAQIFTELSEIYQKEAERTVLRSQKMLEILYKLPEPEVGMTPKEVIWTKNKARLYHYIPVVEKPYSIPILITYALINQPFILDLIPGNSLVEYLLEKGFNVYMIDWGMAGPEDKQLKFDHYVLDYMSKALKKVLKNAGANKINLLGYCMGGTLTAMFAALQPAGIVNNMVLIAAPIDFAQAGLYTVWLSKKHANIDLLVDTMGNIPGELIDFGNKMLKPMTNFVSPYINLWDKVWDDKFLKSWRPLNKWINDGKPFPGEAYRQWIKEFYQENKLTQKQLFLRGKLVDLSRIKCPVLNVSGRRDHIVPISQSKGLEQYISSEKYEYLELEAGHASLVVGKTAARNVWPKVVEWLKP